jgi:hypothetical protein
MIMRRKVTRYVLAILAAATGSVYVGAQTPDYTPAFAPAPPVAAVPQNVSYTAEQLDKLLGPIALYPDPLLSEVLAAMTYPQDVAAANLWLQLNARPTDEQINAQTWDASVKAIAHYPDVVRLLAGNMDWTSAIGNAFASSPASVMDSVQRLRAKAQAAKTLASTQQQDVVNDGNVIEILPAQPDVIYVPQYDPDVVYATPLYPGPWISFGFPCAVGIWFDLGCDWHHRTFYHGVHWGPNWHHPDYGHGSPWIHDRGRPIPVPIRNVFPPRGPDIYRGHEELNSRFGAFRPGVSNSGNAPHAIPVAPGPMRPVADLPKIPAAPRLEPRIGVPAEPAIRFPARSFEPLGETRGPIGRPIEGFQPAPVRRFEPSRGPAEIRSFSPPPAFHVGGSSMSSFRGHSGGRR